MNLRNAIILTGRRVVFIHNKPTIHLKTLNQGKKTTAKLHVTPIRKYPEAKPIPLPDNLNGVIHSETAKWSPHRTRDMTTPAILCHASLSLKQDLNKSNQSTPRIYELNVQDPHVDSYDCTGAVSLNSSMQTNVPEPYQSGTKSTHLNMPGGQWESGNKFIAEDMRSSHYVNTIRKMSSSSDTSAKTATVGDATEKLEKTEPLSKKEQLKRAFKEYGAVIVVFHVTLSLASLGTCYLIVSSGLDVAQILTSIGLGDNQFTAKIAAGAGTFVAAYALHKLFVPVRMSITLGATPFIVKYLRQVGFLKPPKIKPSE